MGNKFLDDLRHADALIHVVDVSGTTDAEGEGGVLSRRHTGLTTGARQEYSWIRPLARYLMAAIGDRKVDTG